VESAHKDLTDRKDFIAMDLATLSKQPDALAAFRSMVQITGLTDQQVSDQLGIDPAQWSRILKGNAHFPINKLCRLFDVCKSEAFLQYLLYARGYEPKLVKRKSRLERELEAAIKRAEIAEMKAAVLTEAIGGRINGQK